MAMHAWVGMHDTQPKDGDACLGGHAA